MTNVEMTTFDYVFDFVIAYGLPLFVLVVGIIIEVGIVSELFAESPKKQKNGVSELNSDKLNLLGLGIIIMISVLGYFIWYKQFLGMDHPEGYSHAAALCAFFVLALVLGIARALMALGLPLFVIAILYCLAAMGFFMR